MVTIEDLKLDNIAIVECWYPGASGGTAVAEAVFGETNRFGKLPFTYYAYNFTTVCNASCFSDMNMTSAGQFPGRSYKYLDDESLALWPFGFGLSYTKFSLSSADDGAVQLGAGAGADATTSVTVTNTGNRAGDEVVFLYVNSTIAIAAFSPDDPAAKKQLIDYERVTLAPGESRVVSFNVTLDKLSSVDRHGTRHVLAGDHALIFSRGHGREVVRPVEVSIAGGQPRLIVSTMEGFAKHTGVEASSQWL